MRKVLLHLAFLCTFSGIYAQNTLSGTVTDSETKESLIGATALLVDTNKGAISDFDGKFEIKNITSGEYQVKISFYGYEDFTLKVTINGNVDLGPISLKPEVVGLEEVEILADVVEERKTPVAISTVGSQDLEERFSDVSLAEVMQNMPGIYTIQGAGGYGDQEIYVRGFDQTNIAFLVNGIPINDMENGRMYWSNFAGLSQVTRTMQVQRGLGASKLAVSSIGGTINMITKPSDRRSGGRIEYQTGTGSWNHRARFTYNTGLKENGWAASFEGSRTTTSNSFIGLPSDQQGAIMPGAFTDAWSYYISASKKINEKHQLMFWGFSAPVNRGTSWTADDRTREYFGIEDPMFNNALGIRNGELFNMRQNKIKKPLTALTHYWDLNPTSNVTTSVYYSRARVYSVQPRDQSSSLFFSDRTSDVGYGITPENLIDWDYLAEENRSNEVTVPYPNGNTEIESITGYASQYYLESRHNDHDWIGLVSNYTKQIYNLRIRGGIDIRHYKGTHYAKVYDLMDGDFILNQSNYGDLYNKLDTENAIAKKGDKTNYYYDGIVNWGSLFGQAEYIKDKTTLFLSATLTKSDMQRIGHFWNGSEFSGYESTSLGKSEKKDFFTYTIKGGANYRINGRHNVYANAGLFTRPPYMQSAFQDSRYSNTYRAGLQVENIYSTEAGYGFKTPFLKANLNLYYLIWENRTTQVDLTDPDQQNTAQIPLVLNGMVSEHKGVEIDFVATPTPALEINGYVSLGDWYWKKVPNQKILIGDQVIYTDDAFDLSTVEGLPVGSAAQTTAGLGFHYKGIRSTYIGARANYANDIPVSYSLEDVAEGYITPEVIKDDFDDYYTVDIYAGRYFDIGEEMSGRISFSVQNVLNNTYVRWASYFDNQIQRGFAYPRTYTVGLSINF